MRRAAWRGVVLAAALDLALIGQLSGAPAPRGEVAALAPIERPVAAELAGKGETTAWVVLKAKADLSAAYGIPDWNARGIFVYERLTAVANQSQAGLRQFLAGKGVQYQPFWIVDAIEVHADAATFGQIAARPEVEKIVADRTYTISPTSPGTTERVVHDLATSSVEWGVAAVNAPQVWSTYGDHGESIVVATIDTGVRYTHAALVNQYRGNKGDGTFDHNYNWWDPARVCGNPSLAPCDNNGHGTHTMGTIVGDDGTNQVGVAPKAKWIAAKGCESSSCTSTSLLSSGQFMLAPTDLNGQNPKPGLRPNIVSNSWGDGPSDPFYQTTVQNWVAAGIFPVFANGNSGPGCGTVGVPGAYPESYGVGAFDSSYNIASFSSRGPAGSFGNETKPNVSAPGVNVTSSYNTSDTSYASLSGTSMATPHVAGVVALVWSAAPSLIGNVAQTRQILDQSAVDVSDLSCGGTAGDNNVWGEGRVDAKKAVDSSPIGDTGTLNGTVTDASNSQALGGASVTVTANVGGVTRSTTTDPSGGYSMTLSVGDYTVSVSDFGYQASSPSGVTISKSVVTTKNVSLTPLPRWTVSGYVRAGGVGVQGATVTVLGTPLSTVTIDSSGFYSFTASVPDGTYSFRADPPATNRCLTGVTNSPPLVVSGDVSGYNFDLPQKQDSFGYGCQTSTANSFISGSTLLALSGDDATLSVTLPFTFSFYGTSYSSAIVSTNGFLSFTDASTNWSNTSIPYAGSPNTAIYPYWDDLYVDTSNPGTGVYTATLGAPNRFVIEWRQVSYFGDSTRRVSFEIVLYDTGEIQTIYDGIAPNDGRETGNSATVGIENRDGTVALQYAYNEAVLSTGLGVRYSTIADTTAPIIDSFTASSSPDGTIAHLSWTAHDVDDNVASYRISQNGSLIATPDGTATSYDDLSRVPGTTYTYSIVALDTHGNVSAAASASVTMNGPDITPPTAPANLRVVSAVNNQLTLTWDPSTDNTAVAGYRVYKGTTLKATLSASTTTWANSPIPGGSTSYSVAAFDAAGNVSPRSNTLLWPSVDTVAPAAPTNLQVTSVTSTKVTFAWVAASDNYGLKGYYVYRNGKKVATLGPTSLTWTDSRRSQVSTYYVVAFDWNNNLSAASNIVTVAAK